MTPRVLSHGFTLGHDFRLQLTHPVVKLVVTTAPQLWLLQLLGYRGCLVRVLPLCLQALCRILVLLLSFLYNIRLDFFAFLDARWCSYKPLISFSLTINQMIICTILSRSITLREAARILQLLMRFLYWWLDFFVRTKIKFMIRQHRGSWPNLIIRSAWLLVLWFVLTLLWLSLSHFIHRLIICLMCSGGSKRSLCFTIWHLIVRLLKHMVVPLNI